MKLFNKNNDECENKCKEKLAEGLNKLTIEKDTIIHNKDLEIEKLEKELENKTLEHDLFKKQKIEVLGKLSVDIETINNSISSQASVSEELTATIEEINATISSISERVNSAYEGAKTNGVVMNKFNNDNKDIYDNTKVLHIQMQNVSKIIETINSISKQTNLLCKLFGLYSLTILVFTAGCLLE
jgi:methyl-accepting chemotaxis protein